MIKHEDERRELIEAVSDEPMRAVKILYAKEGCVVGNHYHNKKDEHFFLVSGSGTYVVGDENGGMELKHTYFAPRGVRHTFFLDEGSVLLTTASEPFDPEDENYD